uniref:Homeobox C13 n=1 Tax=Junco hyemalis TaxID=40217 RepID=A0A8C5NSH8_JUNHY
MTAPLGLPPRWPDALGCRCEDAPREKPRMESLGQCRDGLGHCRDGLGHCREMLPHAALGAPGGGGGGGGAGADGGAAFAELAGAEPARQCPSGSLGYGAYPFAPGYYGCRLNLPQKPCGYHPPEKFGEAGGALGAEELPPARAKEFPFYPGFPGSYQAVPGYLDVSVVPALAEPRHEALLPMEGYQGWALANAGWDGQVYCSKEQPQPAHLWKAPFPGRHRHRHREKGAGAVPAVRAAPPRGLIGAAQKSRISHPSHLFHLPRIAGFIPSVHIFHLSRYIYSIYPRNPIYSIYPI